MIDINDMKNKINISLFEKTDCDNILKKINDKDSFFVYFGDELCPWCRCVIDNAIECAKNNHIDKIYYVKLWDGNGNEVVRDKIELDENNNIKTIFNGLDSYNKLVSLFKDNLREYTLLSKDEIIHTQRKRIYAPSFIFIKDGKLIKIIDGVSKKLDFYDDEITKEIYEDQNRIFDDFFKTINE